ncbi:MAG: hypothetical protein ND807_06615 [Vicinamibacterales bacterium]|nr:hypothetical protein [Vicinamibacterales bacterium]
MSGQRALIACLIACTTVAFAQNARPDDPALVGMLRWLEVAQLHTPGEADVPATEIGRWSRIALVVLAGDIRKLATFLQRAREGSLGPLPTIQLYNRRFTLVEIEKVFHGNDTLKKGAVLHADIAVLVVDDASRRSGFFEDASVFMVDDGRRSGVRYESAHWQIGRALLDGITPSPGADAGALLWYRAASSCLLRDGHLAESRVHLDRARQLFPNSSHFLLDSAYLHQKFSSDTIQAAVEDLRSARANPDVGSRRMELERAERFFRQTLALEPAAAGARIRLGHTLGELGRHEEAASELRRAIDARLDGPDLYFAELFLGYEEQTLGKPGEAKRHYENAAELYPRAQSPWLALSQLARQSGDRAGALGALRSVTALPPDASDRWDPWWDYYEVHRDDAERLLDQMRDLALTEVR